MGSHRVGHDWSDLAAAATEIEYTAIKNKYLFRILTIWILWLKIDLLFKTIEAWWSENLAWLPCLWGFPGGSEVKRLSANTGEVGLIPGWGRSLGQRNGNTL